MHRDILPRFRGILPGLVVVGLVAGTPVVGEGVPLAKKRAAGGVPVEVVENDRAIALEVAARERRLGAKHERPEWWPFESGPRYGLLGHEGPAPGRDLIHVKAGDIPLARGMESELPGSLRRNLDLTIAGKGGPHAYLLALPTEETYRAGRIRSRIEQLGVDLLEFLPRESVLLRVKTQDIPRVLESPLFDHVEPYHPAYKIDFHLGSVPLWNRERAESDVLNVRVIGHRGEDPDRLIRSIERAGGAVQHQARLGDRSYVEVDIHKSDVFALAHVGAVASIEERREYHVMNTTGPSQLQTGRYNRGAVPFFDAGITGGGEMRCVGPGGNGSLETIPAGDDRVSGNGKWIMGGGNVACDTTAAGDDEPFNPGAPLVAPQLVCVADNGASLDAAGLSDTLTEPCVGGNCPSAGTSMGAGVGDSHRKVQAYQRGSLTDGTSSGDLTNCDSAASGAGSHGNQIANIILGNPSRGIEGLGITRNDEDQDTNGEFDETFLPLDGQARGARLIFQDISVTSTGSANPCNQLPGAFGPGANFVDQSNVVPGSIAQRLIDCGDAHVINLPFGVPSFDNVWHSDIDTGHYLAGAVEIDAYLWRNRGRSLFLPTGNDGSDPFNGTNIYPDDPGHPQGPFPLEPTRIQVNHLATAKNAVTVGGTYTDVLDFFGNFDMTEQTTNFSSKGPATYASYDSDTAPLGRVAPQVMAIGADLAASPAGKMLFDPLFNSSVVLRSSDNDNSAPVEGVVDEGSVGTSYASAHAAGAAALAYDYFAQGFYPTGSATEADRHGTISGALVRALLTGSANFMTAFTLSLTRFNNEQGYGRVEMTNMFPLPSFPGGPVSGDPRAALRPPNRGTPPTIPTIPTSLRVFDEFFEGGGTWRKNGIPIATGLAVLEEGGISLETTIDIVEPREQLRVALSWYDPEGALDAGGLLINDLDLEVESPGGAVYLGNNFLGEFSRSTGTVPASLRDSANPVETVVLNRPLELGTWRIRVKTSDPAVVGAPNAPCVIGGSAGGDDVASGSMVLSGPNGICESGGGIELVAAGSAPLPFGLAIAGGFLEPGGSAVRLSAVRYDCSDDLNFTILETSPGMTTGDVNAGTTIRVFRANTVVDMETSFSLLQDGFNFSTFDPVEVQKVAPGATGTAINGVLEVNSGDTIELEYLDGPGSHKATARVDCEALIDIAIFGTTGLNNQFIITGGCDEPFGGTFAQGDLHLDAGETILYQVSFQNSGPVPILDLSATLTCTDPNPGGVDPCVVLSPLPQTVSIGDLPIVLPNSTLGQVATAVSFNLQVNPNLEGLIPDVADRAVILTTTLLSSGNDLLLEDIAFSFTHALQADTVRLHYSTDYPQGTQACVGGNEGQPCNSDTDCGGGACTGFHVGIDLNRDGKIDPVPVTRELITYEPITYDPTTGLANRNVTSGNALEVPDLVGNPWILDADGPDDVFGKQCFLGATSVGPGCTTDGDCSVGETCRSDDPIPWSMDGPTLSGTVSHANAGATGMWVSYQNPTSDPGFPTPSEIWLAGGGGACGFQSQDRAGGLFRRAGVWHAGNGVASPNLTDCPDYPTPGNPATVLGAEFLKWALISPVIQKVNTGVNARGFEFTVSMERTAWNENVQLFDSSVYIITNMDNDLRTAANVDPVDDPQQRDDFITLFVSEAYVNTVLNGPIASLREGQTRFGGARDTSSGFPVSQLDPDGSLGPSPALGPLTGDEVGVARTLGGIRGLQVANVTTLAELSNPQILERLPHPVEDQIPDGAVDESDDFIDLVNGNVLCGPNERSDTTAAGGDAQVIAQGAPCASAVEIAVSGDLDGLSLATLAAAQQSYDRGPVRNNEQDQTGWEDTYGPSSDKWQFSFQWMVLPDTSRTTDLTAAYIIWRWEPDESDFLSLTRETSPVQTDAG